jgi:hypothetical protein
VRWGAIEVKVVFLNVFTMVTLTIRESEQSLFENRITPVPQTHGEAQQLFVVA